MLLLLVRFVRDANRVVVVFIVVSAATVSVVDPAVVIGAVRGSWCFTFAQVRVATCVIELLVVDVHYSTRFLFFDASFSGFEEI
jgi:hypothetical protein